MNNEYRIKVLMETIRRRMDALAKELDPEVSKPSKGQHEQVNPFNELDKRYGGGQRKKKKKEKK